MTQSGISHVVTEVFCGEARGVDLLGRVWAKFNSVPVRSFPADWDAYGHSAGMVRNGEMAMNADALVAVWDGHSRGTADMIRKAKARNLFVHVLNLAKQ